MTHSDQIMKAVAFLVSHSNTPFSRQEVRDQIGLNQDDWKAGYTAVFQGMRDDHPGGAPQVGEKYRGVFHRVAHGQYVLTKYGKELAKQY